MAKKVSQLSGAEREQRIIELKRKLQEAAQKAKAAHTVGATPARMVNPSSAPAVAAAPAQLAPRVERASPAAEVRPVVGPAAEVAPAGSKVAATLELRPGPAPRPASASEPAVPALTQADMTRCEFLSYAWGAALGLLTLEGGVISYLFLYPRFREGEFGGVFRVPALTLPGPTDAPVPNSDGKFWLIQTDEGSPKALYMVCTHLGCLYKWTPSNNRFECPCHGSKFSHDGFYIEGPAPRSLDSFEFTVENDQLIINTGAKILGAPSAESPARAQV